MEQTKWKTAEAAGKGQTAGSGRFCLKCGAWLGAFGLEPVLDCGRSWIDASSFRLRSDLSKEEWGRLGEWLSKNGAAFSSLVPPDLQDLFERTGRCGICYVCHSVEIFREVRRVLRDDGLFWLNIGDSFSSGGRTAYAADNKLPARQEAPRAPQSGELKSKDLMGVPWAVAFALRNDGWYLRSDIIFSKPNPMPESVRDRPTRAHEFIFQFAKSDKYFYDIDAVREPFADAHQGKDGGKKGRERNVGGRSDGFTTPNNIDPSANGGRNIRSVWVIKPKPYRGAHFAVFSPELPERCIRASTSEHGVCSVCGAPYIRVTDRKKCDVTRLYYAAADSGSLIGGSARTRGGLPDRPGGFEHGETTTVGWEPTCTCGAGDLARALVLDPFSGAATTGITAYHLGRDYFGIEINPEYVRLSHQRRTDHVTEPSQRDQAP